MPQSSLPDSPHVDNEIGMITTYNLLIRDVEFAVRTRPDTTLAGHCALELFSCFMDAIAARIKAIGGSTQPLYPGPSLEVSELSFLQNSLLQSIASGCVSAGLAHDDAEAYTVIIPAFLKQGLLSDEQHGDIKYGRNEDGSAFCIIDGEWQPAPISQDE
jgi:hypothetical protein